MEYKVSFDSLGLQPQRPSIPNFDDAFDLYTSEEKSSRSRHGKAFPTSSKSSYGATFNSHKRRRSHESAVPLTLTNQDKGKTLFNKIRKLNPKAPKDDYYDEEDKSWDLWGLREDLKIEMKKLGKDPKKAETKQRRHPPGIPASIAYSKKFGLSSDEEMESKQSPKRRVLGLPESFCSSERKIESNSASVHSMKQFHSIMTSRNIQLIRRLKHLLERRFRHWTISEISEIIKAAQNDRDIYEELFPRHKMKQDKSDIWAANMKKNTGRVRNRIANISDFLDIPVEDYLDVGVGNGEITIGIGERFALDPENIHAVDVRDHLLEGNRALCSFEVVEAEQKLPFPDQSIDLITAFMSLHHSSNKDLKLKISEIYRVLRDGGTLIIREHDCNLSGLDMVIDIEHILYDVEVMTWQEAVKNFYAKYRSRGEWDRLFEKSGLKRLDYIEINTSNPTNFYYAVYEK